MTMSQNEAAQIRAKATEIVQRMQADPAFREQVMENPVTTLQSAGIPDEAINDFTHELGATPEVSGYAMAGDCTVLSCIFTDVFQH